MNIDLQGRRALVCGASRGIGAAIAVELAGAGAAVTGAARDTTRLESLVADIRAAGGTADYLTLDLERLDEAEEMVAAHVHGFDSTQVHRHLEEILSKERP